MSRNTNTGNNTTPANGCGNDPLRHCSEEEN